MDALLESLSAFGPGWVFLTMTVAAFIWLARTYVRQRDKSEKTATELLRETLGALNNNSTAMDALRAIIEAQGRRQ